MQDICNRKGHEGPTSCARGEPNAQDVSRHEQERKTASALQTDHGQQRAARQLGDHTAYGPQLHE